jgi:glycosyltransferase involved in cell wall biosynthesis
MKNITKSLSQKILTIGPDYHNHRGGIGAVIEIYSKYFENFNFIPTYKVGSKLFKAYVFISGVCKLCFMLITNHKIKIVHIHGASNSSFYRKFTCYIISKFIFKKKVIYHIHGGGFADFYESNSGLVQNLVTRFIEQTDAVICLSNSWLKYYTENFTPQKIDVIPNIVEYPVNIIWQKERDKLIFLFLGLICDAKGIFDLVNVISMNKAKYQSKIKLIIGGNGEISRLQKNIIENKLEDIIEFVGWVTNEDKEMWLQKASVYILPSYHEGLPISILEAMSYGQAIISTKVGGIPEIVGTGENGILIESGNLAEIESAIDFIIEHPDCMKRYGAESIKKVKTHLPESVINELSTIYLSIL